MSTNQIINVLNLDPYMSKYKSYCISSAFLYHFQSANNTLIVVNSGPSSVKTERWLGIFQTAKKTEFFYPLGVQNAFYKHHIKKFLEQNGKSVIQNRI